MKAEYWQTLWANQRLFAQRQAQDEVGSQASQKISHGLHSDAEGFVRLVHEWVDMFGVARQQVGGVADHGRLEDGPPETSGFFGPTQWRCGLLEKMTAVLWQARNRLDSRRGALLYFFPHQ